MINGAKIHELPPTLIAELPYDFDLLPSVRYFLQKEHLWVTLNFDFLLAGKL
jgi:hypothetical protein